MRFKYGIWSIMDDRKVYTLYFLPKHSLNSNLESRSNGGRLVIETSILTSNWFLRISYFEITNTTLCFNYLLLLFFFFLFLLWCIYDFLFQRIYPFFFFWVTLVHFMIYIHWIGLFNVWILNLNPINLENAKVLIKWLKIRYFHWN